MSPISMSVSPMRFALDADPTSRPADEIVEPRPADPVHLEQHIAKSLLAIQVLGDLAGF
jgi:hypothetical protein